MARWDPDARGRLRQAALELFSERGYTDVTVAEIADRAGLTRRSFFNHFADKREVFFADAQGFTEDVLYELEQADPELDPMSAAVQSLTRVGQGFASLGEYAQNRQHLIATTPELRERDLVKTSTLTAAMAATLRRRGASDRVADFAAQSALAVLTAALNEWIGRPDAHLPDLMQQSLADLGRAVVPDRDAANRSRRPHRAN